MRHAKAHRAFCIETRAQQQQSEESESQSESESESDSDAESVGHAAVAPASRGRAGVRASGAGMQVPGLTPQQIEKLLALSAKAENSAASTDIAKLQKQIAQLMEVQKESGARPRVVERSGSGAPVNLKDIKDLQRKLVELEKKTQGMGHASQNGAGGNFMPSTQRIYTPVLVKDDPAFRKYFKLLDMSMPVDQIRAKMETEGVSPSLLDTPDAVSPNDPGVRLSLLLYAML